MGAVGGSIPGSVMLGNDEQGFIGDARKDGSGRIRSCTKIKATASDGAESIRDHFVCPFYVRKSLMERDCTGILLTVYSRFASTDQHIRPKVLPC